MAFFDDDGEPPTRVRSTARPPARPRQPDAAARPSSLAPPDADALRNRRIGLGVGILVFVVLLGLLINSCRNSARDRALREYNGDVTALVDRSRTNSQQLFEALSTRASSQDTRTAIQQIRLDAEDTANRAAGLDVRDEMKPAQRNLLLALDLRAEAIGAIADLLPEAQGNDQSAGTAVRRIAGQMRAFVASDVIYSQRVAPLIEQAFRRLDIGGQTVVSSAFLTNDGWLSARQVADQINPDALADSSSSSSGPGPHGHGLVSTRLAGTALSQNSTTSVPITSGARPAVDVTFANQGNSDQSRVRVTIEVTVAGQSRSVRRTLNATHPDEEVSVRAQLPLAVQVGQAAQIEVSVGRVPGEENLDNNRATYPVSFTQ